MTSIPLVDGVVDIEQRLVVRSVEARLSLTEARLLAHLARHPERVFGREELQVEVWGYRPGIASRTVFTTIGRLRGKIEVDPAAPRHLVTVPGEGYRFLPAAPSRRERRPSSLPKPPTPFVGRAAELGVVAGLLEGDTRLVTLLGPGGAGKTRLALAVGERCLEGYERVAFVALDAVASAAGVPPAVARGVGLSGADEADLEGLLLDRLAGASTLLILDNFEHVLGAAGFVERLLGACPAVSALVTSRVRLGLRREVAVPVEGMALPEGGEDLAAVDAGRLLLDVASRARPGWTPAAEDRDVLADICRRVGGAPLAIELAAAWLRLLEPHEIARELASSVDILASTQRDVPERHRSMRTTLEASWRLLDRRAADTLARLSVFRGAFDRRSAEDVAGADLLILGQLVDSSMVRRRGGRFDLHPLVRQTAQERLSPSDGAAARATHARWFLARATPEGSAFDLSDEAVSAALGDDHDELAAAARWAIEAGDAKLLGPSFELLFRHYEIAGRVPELVDLLGAIRRAFANAPRSPARDRLLGVAIMMGAGLGKPEGDVSEAMELLEGVGGTGLILGLINRSICAMVDGELAGRLVGAERSVELARAAGHVGLVGFAASVTGCMHLHLRRFDRARALLEEAVRIGEPLGGQAVARPLVHLGELRLATGDWAGAAEALERALRATQRAGDRRFRLLALCRLGEALEGGGDDPSAPWIEAIEDGIAERLPVYWWARAVVGLGRRVVQGRLGDEPALGAAILAAAEALPLLPETRERVAEGLRWAGEAGLRGEPLAGSPDDLGLRLLAL